ncbi:MAG: DsbA family protein [Alphaproteobacteria bacterium]|nr:DsbA family protein [Alphaproteobacteria bacterium]
MSTIDIPVYIDFKSPYAYLAIKPLRAMALEYDVSLDWRPHNLPIAEFLGGLDDRNEHQWRRVKYSYMDVRRLANQRGMTILGPRKLFDSTNSSIGLMFAKRAGVTDAYIDITFERFFKRELDIEDPAAVNGVLVECGAEGFLTYLNSEGSTEFAALVKDAHLRGVFGVPSMLLDDELFWGNERLELLQERIRAQRVAASAR